MSNADIRGRFVWHELMTTDTKAASAFYPKVTGWRSQPWDKDPSYTLWLSAKGPFGGVRTLPDAARSHGPSWLAYVGTPDVDASLQHAQKLGARVSMGATDIPDTGRMAVLADPQGAAFALFSAGAGSAAGSGSATGPSDFSWHELTTSDVEAAIRFYGELFGWRELNKHDMGAMGTYHLIGLAGAAQPVIGMYQSPADKPMPTRWMCYAHVTDIDKSANAAKSGGGKVVHGPMEVPGGTWIAHCIDPQGAAFAVHADQRVAASAPAAQPSRPAAPAAAPPKSPPPPRPAAPAPKPTAPAPKPAAPPTLSSPPSPSAPTVKPVAPKAAASPAPSTATATAAPSSKPAAPHAAAAAKKAPAKKAAAKVAKKASKKKAGKKKAAAKRRPHKKAKAAKKKTRRAAAKRKATKKRGKTSHRRAQRSGLAAARRVAVKQARSLLRRLRGKRHR
jgi:predicted enzyme related to lactoylglutathione lyase